MRKFILLTCFLLSACGVPGMAASCQDDVKAYSAAINPITVEWGDAINLAGSVPRMSLAPQIAVLQQIRRKADTVTVPECTKAAHGMLTSSMDTAIQTFLDFLSQKPGADANRGFTESAKQLGDFQMELIRLASGIPATAVP